MFNYESETRCIQNLVMDRALNMNFFLAVALYPSSALGHLGFRR